MSDTKERKDTLRRIIQIDQYISSGIYPTKKFLAEKLERSERTIARDIEEMILSYDAPIASVPGKGGYYYTEPNFFLKNVMLTEGELFSVTLFDQLLEQYRNTPLEENLRHIFNKITASLPDMVSFDSGFLKSNVTYISDAIPEIDNEVFSMIFKALQEKKVLEFDYRPLQKQSYMTRTLKPYHAVCQKGNWYILGYCDDKQDIRIFSFSRIKNPVIKNEKFVIPADFNPEDYFDKELGIWLSAKTPYKVELLISGKIGTYALDYKFRKNQKSEIREDGSVFISFETTQLPEIKRWVLGQGSTVKVISPQELIDEVCSELQDTMNIYKKGERK